MQGIRNAQTRIPFIGRVLPDLSVDLDGKIVTLTSFQQLAQGIKCSGIFRIEAQRQPHEHQRLGAQPFAVEQTGNIAKHLRRTLFDRGDDPHGLRIAIHDLLHQLNQQRVRVLTHKGLYQRTGFFGLVRAHEETREGLNELQRRPTIGFLECQTKGRFGAGHLASQIGNNGLMQTGNRFQACLPRQFLKLEQRRVGLVLPRQRPGLEQWRQNAIDPGGRDIRGKCSGVFVPPVPQRADIKGVNRKRVRRIDFDHIPGKCRSLIQTPGADHQQMRASERGLRLGDLIEDFRGHVRGRHQIAHDLGVTRGEKPTRDRRTRGQSRPHDVGLQPRDTFRPRRRRLNGKSRTRHQRQTQQGGGTGDSRRAAHEFHSFVSGVDPSNLAMPGTHRHHTLL